jgi:hypothetical protein
MSNFTYSVMSGKNDPMYGKFEHPIKALIEQESDLYEKRKSIVNDLFNVEKSSHYSETIIGESDFDTFQSREEGQKSENDSVEGTFKKTISHIEFGKKFEITKKMADDSRIGIAAQIKNKPRAFVRAYYKTRIKLAAQALIHATDANMVFNKSTIDLTTGDGHPLFYKAHPYYTDKGKKKGSQSNYFYGDLSSDTKTFEEAIAALAIQLRNFRDENGDVMGYTADTIIIPCNRPVLESIARKVCGSEKEAGTSNNAINTQYGNWTLVVLDEWTTDADEIMVMSSEANKNLMGNMFFDRVGLTIRNWIDNETYNYCWNGYCRMGVGFGGWKHILRAKHSTTDLNYATKFLTE